MTVGVGKGGNLGEEDLIGGTDGLGFWPFLSFDFGSE